MNTFILNGWMEEFTGYNTLKLQAKSVGIGIQLLEANFRGIARKIRKGLFGILVNGKEISVYETNLFLPDESVIEIVPIIEGAGNSGKAWAYIIIGAILIVASFYMPQSSYLGMMMMGMGMSMAFGGIALLLAPSTGMDSGAGGMDDNKSFLFGGAVNSIEQGGTIGIVYGKFGIGSTVISSALEATSTLGA